MNIDVVIVTYNRLEKLKKTLQCYENQTARFRNLIIVNNHSTDGTFEFLQSWSKKMSSFEKHIINSEDNLGGSGGFFLGQKYSMQLNPDWIYLADDDAYPDSTMIEKFYEYISNHNTEKISAICGAVYNLNGEISCQHRSTYSITNLIHYTRKSSTFDDYKKECFEIDFLSYVCSFLNAKALKKYGLVNPNYFIYYDDTEHSLRLKKYGAIICVPSIKIEHEESGGSLNNNSDITWQDYYYYRNRNHMLKKHHPLVAINNTRLFIKHAFRHQYTDNQKKVIRAALIDMWLGTLGKHSIYKPGWKMEIHQQ